MMFQNYNRHLRNSTLANTLRFHKLPSYKPQSHQYQRLMHIYVSLAAIDRPLKLCKSRMISFLIFWRWYKKLPYKTLLSTTKLTNESSRPLFNYLDTKCSGSMWFIWITVNGYITFWFKGPVYTTTVFIPRIDLFVLSTFGFGTSRYISMIDEVLRNVWVIWTQQLFL